MNQAATASRFVILPAGAAHSLETGELPIYLAPSETFAAGSHPTTRLCLAALASAVHPGDRVLDLGTGSGTLSIAAARLGAARVLGLDVDPEIAAVAAANAALNGVGEVVRAAQGTVATALIRLAHGADRPADVAVANQTTRIQLNAIGAGLPRAVRPGGCLILSGILATEAEAVECALLMAGMAIVERRRDDAWLAIVSRRSERGAHGS